MNQSLIDRQNEVIVNLYKALKFYSSKRNLGTTTDDICKYYWIETGETATEIIERYEDEIFNAIKEHEK